MDLNMVRAGVVKHPSEWGNCEYHELQNPLRDTESRITGQVTLILVILKKQRERTQKSKKIL